MKSQLVNQISGLLKSGVQLSLSEKVMANFVLADDVVAALIFLANNENAIGESYNFSNDVSLATFLALIENHFPPRRKIRFSGNVFSYLLWVSKWLGLLNISSEGVRFFSNTKEICSNKIEQ
jgi:nucleoside-diphosphate-sugar epimerase